LDGKPASLRNGERVCRRVHNPKFEVRVLVSQEKKEEKMEKKVVYVREHYNKEVRKSILDEVNRESEQNLVKGYKLNRKKQRVWTLNRSPHGNKTAREQFGRQVWQRRRERGEGREKSGGFRRRKKILYGIHQHVSRKERTKEIS
jgi:hypothetical protein